MTAPAFLFASLAVPALASVNALTFALFGIDKARAARGSRRVREATLLRLALVGGTPGAYAARAVFRHKTRKQPFARRLHAIAVLQAAALLGVAVWWGRG